MASERESQRGSPGGQETPAATGNPVRAPNLSALPAMFEVPTLDELGDLLSADRDLDVIVRSATDDDLDGVEILVHDRGSVLRFPVDPAEVEQVADELEDEVSAHLEANDTS